MPQAACIRSVVALLCLVALTSALTNLSEYYTFAAPEAQEGPRWLPTERAHLAHRQLHRVPFDIEAPHTHVAEAAAASLDPGSPVAGFQVATLDGVWRYTPSTNNSAAPTVVLAFNQAEGFLDAMWTNDHYTDALLQHSPANAVYAFASYADKPASQARSQVYAMRARLVARMAALNFTAQQQSQWLARLHFIVTPVPLLDNWIVSLLNSWTMPVHQVTVTTSDGTIYPGIRRLDARWPWAMSPQSIFTTPQPVALFSNACQFQGVSRKGVSGKVALVARSDGACSFFDRILNAYLANATAVVVYTSETEPLIDMNCASAIECDLPAPLPATMISYEAGIQLAKALSQPNSNITVTFTARAVPGFYFALDTQSQLQELGNLQYPSMQFVASVMQYLNFHGRMQDSLTQEAQLDQPYVIPIFSKLLMNGPASVNVTLPSPAELRTYTKLELDMTLDCNGPMDSSCPAWDRILQVFVACQGNPLGVQELGRWITPFGRRVGRWLTDATPLMPLLFGAANSTSPNVCTFSITVGTTENWVPSFSLRLLKVNGQTGASLVPFQVLPLYTGFVTFNQTYNSRAPVSFSVPPQTVKVLLYTVITGHGSDNLNCAEFCVTSHSFRFNNLTHAWNQTFDEAGTQLGCSRHVVQGVEPNEYGTWLYGRDGWCDGLQVAPYVMDITNDLSFPATNTLVYRGLYNGTDPNPTNDNAYMVLATYLSFLMNPPTA